ncbi:MAG TPA: PQQ-binding-like beta-propeller repeat protein, partial [Vicinamibacterales bacterium]|nr:PQQ-binding-like beta-propeller repeat protein [Vicinamibacterales bacterium]
MNNSTRVWLRYVAVLVAVLAPTIIAQFMWTGLAQTPNGAQSAVPDAAGLYNSKCAVCHELPSAGSRAPNREALQARSPEIVVDALTGGSMRYQGLSLSGTERRVLAEYLTGKKMGGDLTGASKAICANPPPLSVPEAGIAWNGWGPTPENTHFQSAAHAGLTAEQVPKLTLKWAFGFPDTTSAWAQPTIVGSRMFIGSQNGTVYSFDARTGCVVWTFTAEGGVRSSIYIDRRASGPAAYGAYFVDQKGYAFALDAATGKLLWKRLVEDHPLIRLTGSPLVYNGLMYLGTSSYEESGKPPDYECCNFRGSIVALDAMTG